MKTNTDKNGNKFHNFGSGKDRVVVYEPKDSKNQQFLIMTKN